MTSGFYEQLGVDPEASAGQLRAAYGRAVAKLVRRRKQIVEQGGDPAQLDEARTQLDEAWGVLSDPVRRRRYDAMATWGAGSFKRDAETLWTQVGDSLVHPAAALAAKLLRVTTHLQQIGQMPIAPSSSEDEPPTLVPHDDDLTAPRASARKLSEAASAPIKAPMALAAHADDRTAPSAQIAPAARPVSPEAPPNKGGGSVVPLPRPAPSIARPAPTARAAPSAPQLSPEDPTPEPALRVVDGSPAAPPVLVLPSSHGMASERTDARVAARPRVVGPEEVASMVDAHGYTGALLRAVREARGLPLQEVADTTRISVRYLEAIEADRFADLPSATFVRGYVREMAKMLSLDAESVVAGYMRRFGG